MDKSAIEYGQAPAQWDAASLAGKVAQLEKQKDDLSRLCGEILATLKVNRERETLITIHQEHIAKFDSWITAWWKRFNECSNAATRCVGYVKPKRNLKSTTLTRSRSRPCW
jgi:hypothetical protein